MLAQEGKSLTGKFDAIVAYVEKNGLLYRKFQSQKVQNGKEFTQLIVPMRYRNVVLKLAHESILAGHMSTARTISRVLSEFFWPGVQSDTKQFCKSYDICQKNCSKGSYRESSTW